MGPDGLADVLSPQLRLPGTAAAAALAAAAAAFFVMAGVAFAVVVAGVLLTVVMVAVGAGVDELAPQVCLHRLVRAAGGPGTELDALLRESCLGSAADAAADQNVNALLRQQPRQGPVAAAVGREDAGRDYLSVLDLIDFEGLRVSEVLEHFSVFIGDCDFHGCLFLLSQDLFHRLALGELVHQLVQLTDVFLHRSRFVYLMLAPRDHASASLPAPSMFPRFFHPRKRVKIEKML